MEVRQLRSAASGLGAVRHLEHSNVLLFFAVDEGDENPTR